MTSDRPQIGPYELFMLALCTYVLGALAAQALFPLDPETVSILDMVDTAVCVVFLIDFFRSLYRAEAKLDYFVRWGWLDLLSSIPAVDWLRWGRAARALRILRLLRGIRSARVLADLSLRRTESAMWGTMLFAVLLCVFGSVAILHFEQAEESNIRSATDALWWSFVTMTTVGYGDHFPTTGGGRVLAAMLMATGIGIFGTLTAYLASSLDSQEEQSMAEEIRELRAEVRALRAVLEPERVGGPK